MEQLAEADAARKAKHFGTHKERHEYCSANFPPEVNDSMRRIWFAYGDLGYDGVNERRAKTVMANLKTVVNFFKERFNEKIEPEISI